MKVLFLSESPINKQVSIGNTFLDVFDGIEDAELHSFYIRNGMPDTSKIKSAFRIRDKKLIRNCLTPKKIGEEIECSVSSGNAASSSDNKFESFVKKNRPILFFFFRTCLWKILPWKHSGFKEYLEALKPDILFTLLTNEIILNDIILYAKKNSDAKLVVYAWDDTYGLDAHSKSKLSYFVQKIRRCKMRKVVSACDKMYVISNKQKIEYEKNYDTKIAITKGIEILTEEIEN